jgi:hypothetical protein
MYSRSAASVHVLVYTAVVAAAAAAVHVVVLSSLACGGT